MSDQVSNDLKFARITVHKLGETFKQLQSHSLSILALSDQWQNLQNSFEKAQNLIDNRVNEAEAEKREIVECKNRLEDMQKEVELKKKELDLEEKSLIERSQSVEIREKQVKNWCESLNLEKRGIVERFKEVELREMEVAEGFERARAVDEEVEIRRKAVEERENECRKCEEACSRREDECRKREEVCCGKEDECRKREEVCCAREDECRKREEACCGREDECRKRKEACCGREDECRKREEACCGKEDECRKREEACCGREDECRKREEACCGREDECKKREEACCGKEDECRKCEEACCERERVLKTNVEMVKLREKVVSKKGEELNGKESYLDVREANLNELSENSKLKEGQLNKRIIELEQKEANFEEKRKELEVKESQILRKINSLETEMNEKGEMLVSKEKMLESREEEVKEDMKKLESKEEEIDERSQIWALSYDVPQMGGGLIENKQSGEHCKYTYSEFSVAFLLHPLFKNMDAFGLRQYLSVIVREKRMSMYDETILDGFRCASDSAKLVLYVCQSFLREYTDKDQATENKNSCIYLLEQFMKLLYPIERDVKDEAMYLAASFWDSLKRPGGNSPANTYGFLLFVAAFDLSSCYNAQELLTLFGLFYSRHEVYRHEQQVSLCCALGLSTMIPGVVNSLIKKEKLLTAIKYVCALKLECQFPLVPLLEAYLDLSKKKVNAKLTDGTLKSKIQAERMELSFLRDVTRCIATFKIESKFPFYALKSRIKELEMGREERMQTINKRNGSEGLSSSTARPKKRQKRPRV